jgi:histidine ammonia-lyase
MAVQTVWASLGVETHASLAATAARATERLLDALRVLVATELVVAVRALRLAGRGPDGAGGQALFAAATRVLPDGLEDRRFGEDVNLAAGVLADWTWPA